MIKDVQLISLQRNEDERGSLMEIVRADMPGFTGFAQQYVSMNYPGIIRAWHYHLKQTDVWHVVKGSILVGLYDQRQSSPTYGQTMEIILSEKSQKTLVIPPGVYHGYKTIGNEASLLLNMTNNYWDKGVDEHRAPYNDSNIPFDWIKVLHK